MDYIVYITDECRKEAMERNYGEAFDKMEQAVERKQGIANFDPSFPAPFLVKKKFGAFRGRLIAEKEIANINGDDYAVIKFLAVFIKADKEYKDFRHNPKTNGEKFLRRIDTEELKKYIEEKIASDPPRKKPPLSDDEKAFLYSSNTPSNLENEPLIYESEEWIKAINSKPYVNYLSAIYDAVANNLVGGNNADKRSIAVKNLHIIFFQCPDKKYLFLIDLCSAKENIENIFEQWKKRKESTGIARLARRSYPQHLLGDENIWFKIEKDAQSNFALSGEEIDVLKSISNPNSFPLFINGRAGNGKSTILQYIFAKYFFGIFHIKILCRRLLILLITLNC
jgi:hypothetical protein